MFSVVGGTRMSRLGVLRARLERAPLSSGTITEFSHQQLGSQSVVRYAPIIVALLILVLLERELFAAAGLRPASRTFLAYALPLALLFLMLVVVQVRTYVDGGG